MSSVRSADCNAVFVVQHDLTEELCPCQHRNISAFHFYKFRIVRMNGCGIYDKINIIGDIFCFLSYENAGAQILQNLCDLRFLHIGTGYGKALLQ